MPNYFWHSILKFLSISIVLCLFAGTGEYIFNDIIMQSLNQAFYVYIYIYTFTPINQNDNTVNWSLVNQYTSELLLAFSWIHLSTSVFGVRWYYLSFRRLEEAKYPVTRQYNGNKIRGHHSSHRYTCVMTDDWWIHKLKLINKIRKQKNVTNCCLILFGLN